MINIGSLLDACGISYTDKQLAKLDKLLHELLNKLSLQQFDANETIQHGSIPDSDDRLRNEEFASETELKPFQHYIQEFEFESEPHYNHIIKEELVEESSIEIKEELPKDPYATLETINSSRDISDVLKEENLESNCFQDLPDHQIELQTPNQINTDVFDPSFNQTYDQIYGRFLCSICNQTFSTKGNLKKHEKKFCKIGSIEMNSEDQKIVEIKDGRFLCSSCNQTFSTKTNLKKHEKISCKSGSIKMNSEDQRRVANDNGRFPCRKCNQEFKTKTIVKIHEKKSCKGKEALANKKGIFSCKYCIQTFSFGTNKLRHEKICKKRPEGVKPLSSEFQM